MPLHVSELQESDIPECVETDALAMSRWPLAAAMEFTAQKNGETRKSMVTKWMHQAFENKNPNGIWLKVSDTETGRLVAAGAWTWHLDETFVDRPPPGRTDASENNLFTTMRSDWHEFRNGFFADQKWYYLQTLFTHPEWQRKGAGSLLVKYGCEKADEAGVICALQATEAGLGLYLENGFETVKERVLDLRPFGVDASELRRWMIRKPKH